MKKLMRNTPYASKTWALLVAGLLCLPNAQAENSTKEGAYIIHHNAVTTDILTPKVASNYGVQRSKNRALLTISVQKNNPTGISQPVPANITLTASSYLLRHQRDDIKPLRRVGGGDAVYYITDFPVTHREHLLFEIEALPEGEVTALQAKFAQEFYTR